jgi:hypothetical protein
MALFGNNAKEQEQTGGPAEEPVQEQAGDQSYFDEFAGEGQDQFNADMLSTPYLSMVQAGGSAAANGNEPGTWINSASGENFGPAVEVVCLAVKTAWIERDTTGKTWMTVGRYEPNSIEVEKTMPKPGQRGFPTMINPQTGNKVEELFVYALMLPEHPESGVLFFSPTAISMSACKAWNTKIRNQRLPPPTGRITEVATINDLPVNGATGLYRVKANNVLYHFVKGKWIVYTGLAPIFAFSWLLELATVPKPGVKGDPEDPANRNTKLGISTRRNLVAFDLFKNYVQPQLSAGQNLLAIAAPEADVDDGE